MKGICVADMSREDVAVNPPLPNQDRTHTKTDYNILFVEPYLKLGSGPPDIFAPNVYESADCCGVPSTL